MKEFKDKEKNVMLRSFLNGVKNIACYIGCVSAVILLWTACNNGAKTTEIETTRADETIARDVANEDDADEDDACRDDDGDNICDTHSDKGKRKRFTGGHVCVSEDGRVTIESGTMPCEGNSPEYWSRWTFTDDGGRKHEMLLENTSYQDYIHPVKRADGSIYYIVNCYERSSGEGWMWISAYTISGDTILEVNAADGGNKIKEQEFKVGYSLYSWYDITGGGDCHNWLLDYDYTSQNLYMAITKDYKPTDRYAIWHFDGHRFRHKGVGPNRRLHRSLSQYNSLVCYFKTKDYTVRVDSLDTKELRFASWKHPKTMTDKPDMTIKGGKRLPGTAPEDYTTHDYYSFKHGYSEYLVNYHEMTVKKEGGATCHEYLMIKRNGKVVLKQERI